MSKEELDRVLAAHAAWLRNEAGGVRADLRWVDLARAALWSADLRGALLGGANLRGADLGNADLNGANLNGANLRGAYLRGADLREASLRGADLEGANLRGADLEGADLREASLRGADLSNADLNGARGGPAYASVSWTSHGECGRRLHAVVIAGAALYSCGCWSGDADALQEYIEGGDPQLAPSRRRALWIVAELISDTGEV